MDTTVITGATIYVKETVVRSIEIEALYCSIKIDNYGDAKIAM